MAPPHTKQDEGEQRMTGVLEITFKQSKIFRVGDKDYSLVFTVPVVAALEEKLGRSMKSAADWLRIQTKEVRDILEAGFTHHHPEDAKTIADTICDMLEPEEIENVIDALCVAACPKAMARLQVEIEKIKERAKKGLPPLPNVQSADAH